MPLPNCAVWHPRERQPRGSMPGSATGPAGFRGAFPTIGKSPHQHPITTGQCTSGTAISSSDRMMVGLKAPAIQHSGRHARRAAPAFVIGVEVARVRARSLRWSRACCGRGSAGDRSGSPPDNVDSRHTVAIAGCRRAWSAPCEQTTSVSSTIRLPHTLYIGTCGRAAQQRRRGRVGDSDGRRSRAIAPNRLHL